MFAKLRRNHQVPALLLATLVFGLCLVYSLIVPLGEAPDEPGHYNYARILAFAQRLPLGEEEHEAFQTPLAYVLAAPFVSVGDITLLPLKANADFTLEPGGAHNLLLHTAAEYFPYAGWVVSWRLMRLLSAACAALTAYALYWVGHLLFANRAVALLGASLLTLTPAFTLTHGAASNDPLALTLASFLLLEVLLLARKGYQTKRLIVIGLLWGLATLSKSSLLAAGGAVAFAMLAPPWGDTLKKRLRRAISGLALAGIIMALICGWWFIRNWLVFGDPLAWDLVYSINQKRIGNVNWSAELIGLYRSYWLSYIGMKLPEWLYWLLLAPLAIAIAGLLRLFRQQKRELTRNGSALIVVVYLTVFLVSWMRWAMAVSGTDQARLLYPALLVLAPLLAAGFLAWWPDKRRSLIARAAVLLLLGLNLFSLAWGISPVFAPPQRLPAQAVAGNIEPVRFGEKIELIACNAPDMVKAGQSLVIDTWWLPLTAIKEDSWLTIRLTDAQGNVPVWKRGSPSAGRDTTDRWPLGLATYGQHRLRLPVNLPPGEYKLEAGFQSFGSDSWWPVNGRDLWQIGTVQVLAAEN